MKGGRQVVFAWNETLLSPSWWLPVSDCHAKSSTRFRGKQPIELHARDKQVCNLKIITSTKKHWTLALGRSAAQRFETSFAYPGQLQARQNRKARNCSLVLQATGER